MRSIRWLSRGRVMLFAAAAPLLGAALLASCTEDDPTPTDLVCPNEIPVEGDWCDVGLRCSYADPTGCTAYFTAVCGDDERWAFQGQCTSDGGPGGSGGSPTTGGSPATGGGGSAPEGGQGGGPCTDPVDGPPTVVSALSAIYPADTDFGTYRLEFGEPVSNVASHLSWSGPGMIKSVTKSGSSAYVVRFAGIGAGASAALTVEPGVPDGCGNLLADAVSIELSLYAHCHLLTEDFAGTFPPADWSAADAAATGNVWQRNDLLGAGVPNHTGGSGTCASANDVATAMSSAWDTTLATPAVDLSASTHAALAFRSAFDRTTAGQAWLEASANGTDWTTVGHWTTDRGPVREIAELDDFVGGAAYLRWRYSDDAGAGGYWDVDDVCVEEYTKATCSCPAGGKVETKDILGNDEGNLNGTRGVAEQTGAVLAAVDDRMSACGWLEIGTLSGPDWFTFDVDSGMPGGTMQATLRYCLENSFEPATIELWESGGDAPIASTNDAHTEGELPVTLVDGKTYYLYIAANGSVYETSRYSMTVEIDSAMTALVAEGFEVWPPLGLDITIEDPNDCIAWQQAPETVVPPDVLPTEGYYLAYFNSYECETGSASLETGDLDLADVATVTLSFDMYHDPGYMSSEDEVQVQYDNGVEWTDIGLPFLRPAAVAGWTNESLDLSDFAGQSSVRFRLRATSAYGNDIHIDNVLLMAN